jgi:hypothetical protein
VFKRIHLGIPLDSILTEYGLIIQQQISDTKGFFIFEIAAEFIPQTQGYWVAVP